MSSRPIRRPRRRPVAGRRAILKTGGGGGPSIADWALQGSALDYDFSNNLFAVNQYPSGLATVQLSVANNGGYVQSQAGIWTSIGSNTARWSDKGLLIEEARTNNLLQCRDMTNAAWVKGATVTVAQTQTGIDGTGNSATLVTGGAVQATNTVLQTITLASATDTYSVWLKRVTGSGTVEISPDGSTWTAVTLTTAYQQFQVTQAAVVNPVCGIRIQTNGDQVAADFSMLENGVSFATSPILTTAATATRNADVISLTGVGATVSIASKSLYAQTIGVEGVNNGLTRVIAFGFGPEIGFFNSTTTTVADGVNSTTNAATPSALNKIAVGADNTSMTIITNNSAKATQATSTWATGVIGATCYIGNVSNGLAALNGYIQRAAFALGKGVFDARTV